MKKFLLSITTLLFITTIAFGQTNVAPGDGTLNAAIKAAASGDVLVLENGAAYVERTDSVYVIDKVLTIKSQDSAGEMPVLTFEVDSNAVGSANFFLLNEGATLTLDGLKFYGMVDVVNEFSNVNDFIVLGGGTAGSVTILNCYFHDAVGWMLEGGDGGSMENITIDNTVVSNCKGGPHFKDGDLTGKISVTNSTFMNLSDRFLRAQSGDAEGYVDHCTVYNVDGKRIIMAKGNDKVWVVTNTIFSTFTGSTDEGNIRPGNNEADSLSHCILFSGPDLHGDWDTVVAVSTEDPMFTDAANGDLTLMDGSPALAMASDGGAIGDPRWAPKAATGPTTAAPTPTHSADDVISIFSDAYTAIEGLDLNPNWGQATATSQVSIEGNNTLQMLGLNYQGIDFDPNHQDVSEMDYLHLDYWTSNSIALNIFLISPGPVETPHTLTVPTDGNWVSVDIPLSAFSPVNLTDLFQFKFDGNGDIYIDNLYFHGDMSTSVEEEIIPEMYSLEQNYPNPFNPTTTISFSLPEQGFTTLSVYNALGEIVEELVSETLNAGRYNVEFNAADLSSGIYFYSIQSNDFIQTSKMILMK